MKKLQLGLDQTSSSIKTAKNILDLELFTFLTKKHFKMIVSPKIHRL